MKWNSSCGKNIMICIVIAISMFGCGYYLACHQKNKSMMAECRLEAEKSIYLYCEKLRGMCEIMLKELVAGSLNGEEQARYAVMMSAISNIHDELIALTDSGAESFCCALDGKVSDLMDLDNAIGPEKDPEQNIASISEILSSMDEIKEWLASYTKSQNESIKTVAVEARELMNKNEVFIKMIEAGLKDMGNLIWKNDMPAATREALIEYVDQGIRYKKAMETMRERQTGRS